MSARLTAGDRRLRAVTEADWQHQVCSIADWYGWTWWHAPDNRPVTARSGRRYVQNVRAGFPDLVLCRGPRLLFAELKREGPRGVVAPEQQDWLNRLHQAGAETYIWRPSDLPHVEETLAHPRPEEQPW